MHGQGQSKEANALNALVGAVSSVPELQTLALLAQESGLLELLSEQSVSGTLFLPTNKVRPCQACLVHDVA